MRVNDLGRQLLEAKDLRAFALDALKQPEKGGAFYAYLAVVECEEQKFGGRNEQMDEAIRKIVATESTISPTRLAAMNSAMMRCAGFSEGETDTFRGEFGKHAVKGDDPVWAMVLSTDRYEDNSAARAKALEAIYGSGNLALISETNLLDRYLEETPFSKGLTYRFNGRSYADEADVQIIRIAMRLSVCVEGEYCQLDGMMFFQCQTAGECYSTREEFARQALSKGDQTVYDKAVKIGDELRSAIARGDRSGFP